MKKFTDFEFGNSKYTEKHKLKHNSHVRRTEENRLLKEALNWISQINKDE